MILIEIATILLKSSYFVSLTIILSNDTKV